jgi:hypothetical protein
MQPKYQIIVKNTDGTFSRHQAEGINMVTVKGLPVVTARFEVSPQADATPAVYETVVIDEVVNWLYQSTNAFDKNSNPIYHGDLLKDADNILYEVLYAVGSYFIVDNNAKFCDKKEEAVMLLDHVTRKLEVVGNVVENSDLIKVDTSALEAVANNQ